MTNGASSGPGLLRKRVAEHRSAALGLLLRRLVLDDVPVFDKDTVLDPEDVRRHSPGIVVTTRRASRPTRSCGGGASPDGAEGTTFLHTGASTFQPARPARAVPERPQPHAHPVEQRQVEVAQRRLLRITDVPTGLQGAAALANQQDRQVIMVVPVAV